LPLVADAPCASANIVAVFLASAALGASPTAASAENKKEQEQQQKKRRFYHYQCRHQMTCVTTAAFIATGATVDALVIGSDIPLSLLPAVGALPLRLPWLLPVLLSPLLPPLLLFLLLLLPFYHSFHCYPCAFILPSQPFAPATMTLQLAPLRH
jgi:hypothetical protein